MGFLSFLKPKWMYKDELVADTSKEGEFGFKSKQIEKTGNIPSTASEKQGFWKEFYSDKDHAYVSRHGTEKELGKEKKDELDEVKYIYLYNMKSPEDYEGIDSTLDFDYDYVYPYNQG